jgi:hypothetical protein
VVYQADAAPAQRKNRPPEIVGSKILDGLKNVLALPVQCAASTCSSADGSDGTRGTPSDLAQ